MRLKSLLTLLPILIMLSLAGQTLIAQNYNPFNQRDDEYRLLGLKRSKENYDAAKSEFSRQQELFARGHITKADLERARSIFADAEVNYQQSLLAVLFEKQYVTVSSAIKYIAPDGSKRVKLTIANSSGGSGEFQKLLGIDDELFRSLQPDIVNNVYVSILNNDNAIVSRPYEAKIPTLKYGQPAHLDFALLQDLDAVTIFMIYGNGTQRTMKVFLQKDASEDRVAVQSEQFSQEVELGQTASFDLTLELFSGTSNTFALEVVNLPNQISRFFKSRSGAARLNQVKFTESNRTKRAALEIGLPDRPTKEVAMDTPIPFYVVIVPRDKLDNFSRQSDKMWTEAELDALEVGYVRLELLPRGKGELLVKSPLLYHSIDRDGQVQMYIDLVNEGSHRLDNIEVRVDLPLGWRHEISPKTVASLEIGEEKRIDLTFVPPPEVSPGKYDVRLRASGTSSSQPVTAPDKTITVEIRSSTNVIGILFIVLAVIGLVGGIVVYGVKLTRR